MPSVRYALIMLALAMMAVIGDASDASAARWRWPWEAKHARVHHRTHRAAPSEPPNCLRINEAVKALDPAHLARALRLSNAKQRQTIALCQREAEP